MPTIAGLNEHIINNDMIEIFLITVVSFYAGWKICQVWYLLTIRQMLQDLKISDSQLRRLAKEKGIDLSEEEPENTSDLPVLEVRVEQTDLGLFAYRKRDSLFLARGKDREELMKNLVNNLTNVRVVIAKEDGAELISP